MGLIRLFRKTRTPARQAIIGEKQSANVVKSYHTSFGRYCRLIKDYRYYSGSTSHQVDCIAINSSGIFIIEVKNWVGIVRGGFDDTMWEVLRRGYNPHHYANPIKQNIGHLNSFKKIYKGRMPVYSLVVMAGNNRPLNIPGVRNLKELARYFEEIPKGKYGKDRIDQEYNYIVSLKNQISDKEHLRNINTIKQERTLRIQKSKQIKR